MKKIFLSLLLLNVFASHTMNQETMRLKLLLNEASESTPLVDRKSDKKIWRKAGLIALLAASTIGLATDITTRVQADALNNQVSPITAYPFIPGEGYPFLNGNGPAQKINCTYNPYYSGFIPNIAGLRGNCFCARPHGCRCTIEECPPAQEYKEAVQAQYDYNVASICTRIFAVLGINGWIASIWNKS